MYVAELKPWSSEVGSCAVSVPWCSPPDTIVSALQSIHLPIIIPSYSWPGCIFPYTIYTVTLITNCHTLTQQVSYISSIRTFDFDIWRRPKGACNFLDRIQLLLNFNKLNQDTFGIFPRLRNIFIFKSIIKASWVARPNIVKALYTFPLYWAKMNSFWLQKCILCKINWHLPK